MRPHCRRLRGTLRRFFSAGARAPLELGADVNIVNALRKEQLVRGMRVSRLDEDGNGVVGLYVRKDRQEFEFTFARALPGERLHLTVESAKHDRYNKKVAGKYRLFLEDRGAASPDQVEPECQHFGENCGGCSLQNLAYAAQLREKHLLLSRTAKAYGIKIRPAATTQSPSAFGFHSRTEFKFFLRSGVQLGLHPAKSPVPLAISHCLLHPKASQRAFEALLAAAKTEPDALPFDLRTGQGFLRSATFRAAQAADPISGGHQVLVTLTTTPSACQETLKRIATAVRAGCSDVVGVTWNFEDVDFEDRAVSGPRGNAWHKLLDGQSYLVHSVCGLPLEVRPEAFFRSNLLITNAIYEAIVRLANLRPDDVVWDLFCGFGPSSILLGGKCHRLVSIDRSTAALAALERNLEANGLRGKSQVLCMDLGNPVELRSLMARIPPAEAASVGSADLSTDDPHAAFGSPSAEDLPRPDVVVVDPGRHGMPKAFRRFLYRLRPRTIVCIGVGRSQLRDCVLLERRGYGLVELIPFDSQPHGARLETVAALEWRGESAAKGSSDDGGLGLSADDETDIWAE